MGAKLPRPSSRHSLSYGRFLPRERQVFGVLVGDGDAASDHSGGKIDASGSASKPVDNHPLAEARSRTLPSATGPRDGRMSSEGRFRNMNLALGATRFCLAGSRVNAATIPLR
jgi:hypothetical protein